MYDCNQQQLLMQIHIYGSHYLWNILISKSDENDTAVATFKEEQDNDTAVISKKPSPPSEL